MLGVELADQTSTGISEEAGIKTVTGMGSWYACRQRQQCHAGQQRTATGGAASWGLVLERVELLTGQLATLKVHGAFHAFHPCALFLHRHHQCSVDHLSRADGSRDW